MTIDKKHLTDEQILTMIRAGLSETLPARAREFDSITLDAELQDLAISSLTAMEMVAHVEDQLATTFRREQIARVVRLRDLASVIREACGNPGHG